MNTFSKVITALTILKIISASPVQLPFHPPPSKLEPPLLSANFSSTVEKYLSDFFVPGLSIGVFKGDQVEFAAYGSAGEGRNKIGQDTLFGIASNSKAFTAAAVATFVDSGRLNWTSKVSSVIPEFELPPGLGDPNIIDILSHRTGVPRLVVWSQLFHSQVSYTTNSAFSEQLNLKVFILVFRHDHSYRPGGSFGDFVGRIKHLTPSADFRETWQYNNQMFITAAYLVSHLSNQSFTSYVTERIFTPLNMTSTSFRPSTSNPNLSGSFFTMMNGSTLEMPYGFDYFGQDLEIVSGAGGVVSNARDLVKWVKFLAKARNEAIHPSSKTNSSDKTEFPISPASILVMSSAHSILAPLSVYPEVSTITYGLGLSLFSYQGKEVIWHGGSIPGFGTQIGWSSDQNIGVVALCNTAGTGNAVSDMASYLAFEELLGLKHVDWESRYMGIAEAKKGNNTAKLSQLRDLSTTTTTSSPDSPFLPLSKYYGTYENLGYQNITICPVPTPTSSSTAPQPLACETVYTSLSGALPATPVPPIGPQDLLIAHPGYFGQSYILLTYKTYTTYVGSYGYIYGPAGGRKESVFGYEGFGDVEVEFVLEGERVKGMNWKGVWGPGPEVEMREIKEGRTVVEVSWEKVAKGGWEAE
ncbi:beta-lactamase/transpeptidase-like protein [Meredithblackwellia eburnea MCA 4105]